MRNKFLLAIVAMLLSSFGLTAQIPYAVLCMDDQSLHFLVSETELSVNETLNSNNQTISRIWEVDSYQSSDTPGWSATGTVPSGGSLAPYIRKVIFEESFHDYHPKRCSNWFIGFDQLNEIIGIEYLNTCEVTDMTNMFYTCNQLTELDLSSFDTSNVTDMSMMFYECHKLASLNLSGIKTDKVIQMVAMFEGCRALTELNVSGFNTSNVTNMSGMFAHCTELTELNVSGFNTSNVTNMFGMFNDCSALTGIDLSNFDTSVVSQ